MVQDNESYHLNHWQAQHHQIQAVTQFGSVQTNICPPQERAASTKSSRHCEGCPCSGPPIFGQAVTQYKKCELFSLAATLLQLGLSEQQVRPVSQACSEQRTHHNIADKVHSEDDAGNRDAHGQDDERYLQLRVKHA